MLGNEPALEKYMKEKPRRRDESIISKQMFAQIGIMGAWLTIISFMFLKLPLFESFFSSTMANYTAAELEKMNMPMDIRLTGYFVLFILAALANGFNVRDDGFGIFKGLNENPNFLKVMFTIIAIQALIVNCALIPLAPFKFIGSMFSCVPFGITGWCVLVVLALTMIPVDLIRKACVTSMAGSTKAQAAADAEDNLDISPVTVKPKKTEREKSETKAEAKAETKSETKTEAKKDTKSEAKAEAKTEKKSEEKKEEKKPAQKSENKSSSGGNSGNSKKKKN